MAAPPSPSIFIVSGLPRSGTSLMMLMLQAGGLEVVTDGVRLADEDNPHGYFEVERVRFLAKDSTWLGMARGQAIKVVSPLLAHLPREHHYRILFMRRELDEILASQARMLARRGIAVPVGEECQQLRAEFALHLARTEALLAREPAFQVLGVNYRELVEAPEKSLAAIARFIGLPLDQSAMGGCIDPNLGPGRSAHR